MRYGTRPDRLRHPRHPQPWPALGLRHQTARRYAAPPFLGDQLRADLPGAEAPHRVGADQVRGRVKGHPPAHALPPDREGQADTAHVGGQPGDPEPRDPRRDAAQALLRRRDVEEGDRHAPRGDEAPPPGGRERTARARADCRDVAASHAPRGNEVRNRVPRLERGLVWEAGKGSGKWEGVEKVIFERLARLINKAPWVIVGVAIAFAAIGGIFGGPVAKSLQVGGFQDPSSQSTIAVARLQSASGVRSDGGLVALVKTPDGATSPAGEAEATRVAQVIGADPDIAQAVTFYETNDPTMVARDESSTIVFGFWKPVSDQEAVNGATRLADALNS